MGSTGQAAPVGNSCGGGADGSAAPPGGGFVAEVEVLSDGASNKAIAASSVEGDGGSIGTPRPDTSEAVPASASCLGTVGSGPADELQVGDEGYVVKV